MKKQICERCGRTGRMEYKYVGFTWPGDSPEYEHDLVDGYFCAGVLTFVENDDPCDPDNYESCFNLYCQETGILEPGYNPNERPENDY